MLGPLDRSIGTSASVEFNRKSLEIYAASLFSREINRARLDALIAWLFGRSMHLMVLSEIRPYDPSVSRVPLGNRTVPIDRIRGSENRCDDYDSNFRPLHDDDRQRWINVAIARVCGCVDTPIELIHLNGFYFIRDGHHRISIARALGEKYIDAYILAG